jgi:magnesium transporter
MIRALYRQPDGAVRFDVKPGEFDALAREPGGLLWVDLVQEPAASCEPILRGSFGFHPLAVADALIQSHVPKVDDWGEYLYVVLHAVAFDQDDGDVTTLELDVFWGRGYIVTHQGRALDVVERVWAACQRDERHLASGAGYLMYRLADELVSDYMPAVEGIDETIDGIEDQVFHQPPPTLPEQIFTLKRTLLHLRRIIAPQREVLNKLARGDFAVVAPDDRMYFRDVYDHLVRMYDITESLRDLVGGVLETYLSVVNNRMNEVMKTLTLITTLFMPLSFLAGFFGMNFFAPVTALDAWTDKPAFLIALVVMVVTPGIMYVWMRRRAWM